MLKFCMCCRCLRGDGDSHLTVVMAVDTQTIKRSIAYRAKYRLSQTDAALYRVVAPLMVVPHPENRQVTSLRTKELIGTIVKEACDVVEANISAVAVREQPDDAAGNPPPEGNPQWRSFSSAVAN